MRKDMKFVVTALVCATLGGALALGISSKAFGQTVGDTVRSMGFCLGEEHARKLTRHIGMQGIKGYNSVMTDETTECYDTRIHDLGVFALEVELVEPKWTVRTREGALYQFWRVKDKGTENGFIWIRVPEGRS